MYSLPQLISKIPKHVLFSEDCFSLSSEYSRAMARPRNLTSEMINPCMALDIASGIAQLQTYILRENYV